MFDAIARLLAFFYSLPVVGGSYGIAIILLTATVMIVLMPLTVRATRSTIKMQEVQPKLKELQKKYKDDKPTLNAELMELYKVNGINPVGGCLPMLAQLPVFLVLFRVLSGLSRRLEDTPYFAISDHARTQFGGQALDGRIFDPSYLAADSQMSIDLHQTHEMRFAGVFDLALHPIDVLQDSFVRGIPYVLLILFVVGTSFYQQRQISSRRNGSMAMMNPQQEMILKFLPLMSGIWSFAFPAGLVMYWATSNVFRIAQQGYITRAFYGENAERPEIVDTTATLATDTSETKGTGNGAKGKGSVGGSASGEGASHRNGRSPRTRTGPQAPKPSGNGTDSSNGDSTESDSRHGKMTSAEREQAWARRRQEKARVQAAKSRTEPSSRVTPKGTKPSDSKRKRKR